MASDTADLIVLDCRDADRFAAGHLPGSGHIPTREIELRRYELPPRDERVLVVADTGEDARAAARILAKLGYAHAHYLEDGIDRLPNGTANTDGPCTLWRASPFLVSRLDGVPRGAALDVAAGAGREAVHLALHGFDVEALDRAPEALERAEALAARHGVHIRTRVIDLEKHGMQLPKCSVQLVTVFRFLHRALLPWLETCVAPGGHLIYETFRRGQEVHGRPSHPRFLFWPGELAQAFPALEVLHYEESEPPGGPVMARLHARRSPD